MRMRRIGFGRVSVRNRDQWQFHKVSLVGCDQCNLTRTAGHDSTIETDLICFDKLIAQEAL